MGELPADLPFGPLIANLSPRERARAILEARIQILVNEAIATSAIEGITLDRMEARKAVLRHLAIQEGLIHG